MAELRGIEVALGLDDAGVEVALVLEAVGEGAEEVAVLGGRVVYAGGPDIVVADSVGVEGVQPTDQIAGKPCELFLSPLKLVIPPVSDDFGQVGLDLVHLDDEGVGVGQGRNAGFDDIAFLVVVEVGAV